MKKTVTLYFLANLIYGFYGVQAFEVPALPDGHFVDRCLQIGEVFKERGKQEGIAHMAFRINTHESNTIHLQLAHPIIKQCIGIRHLLRLEGYVAALPQRSFVQGGPTGRYIINSNFIMGGYLLTQFAVNDDGDIPFMVKAGTEWIWPRHGMLTLDQVFTPQHCLESTRYYGQTSLKCSIIQPRNLDIFTTFSIKTIPQQDRRLDWVILGLTKSFPTPRLAKWFTMGFMLYTQDIKTWLNTSDLKLSFYIQGNFLKNQPNNSCKDYLKMPIDRYSIMPFPV